MLLSGHESSATKRLVLEKNFKPENFGYSSVQVMSSCVRWPTNTDTDTSTYTSENFDTEIKYLSEMCDTGELLPMDMIGNAMAADNELVKHERTFKNVNDWNVFDCVVN